MFPHAYVVSAIRLFLAVAVLLTVILPSAAGSHPFFAALSPVQLWWLIMVASGLSLVVATVGTSWQWAGVIAASLLVGTSSQLGLTVPTWFQEIQIHLNTKFHLALYLAIAAQMSVALFVFFVRGIWSGAFNTVKSLGAVRTAIFFVLVLALSATAMIYIANQNYVAYFSRLTVAGGLARH